MLKKTFFPYVGAALVLATTSLAAPAPKITDVRFAEGRLVATLNTPNPYYKGNKQVTLAKDLRFNPNALIVEDGRAVIYSSPGTAPYGYEGENAAVMRFDARSGLRCVVLDEPLNINSLREGKSRRGQSVYLVSMADGGAGIPSVFVVHPTKGTLWEKGAATVSGIRNGTAIIALYAKGEEAANPDAKPIRTIYRDLDQLIAAKK